MAIDNNQRKQNYQALKSIGFTKEEANRLKGGSPEKIQSMVQQKEQFLQSVRQELQSKQEKSGGLRYQSRDEVQARRRENYKALKDAGFTPAEANKLKGAQPVKVQYLVDSKQGKSIGTIHENIKKKLIEAGVKPDAARALSHLPVDKLQRTIVQAKTPDRITPKSVNYKPRGIQYQPVEMADKKYLSTYTYKISYMVKKKDGSKEQRWITVTSPEIMTKKQVKAEAREILTEGADSDTGGGGGGAGSDSAYEEDGDILVSTIEIEEAYYNDQW